MNLDFKRYFTFKKNDRIGIISLSIVTLLVVIIDLSVPKFIKNNHEFDFSEFSAEIDTFKLSLIEVDDDDYVSRLDSFIIAMYDTLELFTFDPNYTSNQEWKLLGLTDKQINTINNYKDRGGSFKIKDDFRKIYGIRTMQFTILKPFIDLPDALSYDNNQSDYNQTSNNKNYILFDFDPNTATDEDFLNLGLSEKQIRTINNYRSKGGRFYAKEDFKKIYVISDYDYNRLSPFIVIEQQDDQQQTIPVQISVVDIATADTAMFKQLPGIGSVLAGRIVKFREKLGGFYDVSQIKEVYGITEDTYNNIKQYLTISTTSVTQININFSEYADLVKHPYINSQTANLILNYKKNNGFYTSVNQLKTNSIIDEVLFEKLNMYLTVD